VQNQKEKSILKVPFYANTSGDGNQCYQVAMQSTLKYFLGKEFSLEELDKLTRRKDGKWTATSQIVPTLYDLGLNVKLYSKSDLEPALAGESYLKKMFGDDYEKVVKFIDVEVFVDSVKHLMKYGLFEKRILDMDEIEEHIRNDHVLLVPLDWSIILGRTGPYQGHFGVITGFDDENIYFHNSGPKDPEPDMKIPKGTFIRAWNANGTDNDIVVVYGKR
jgi:hypothetical protein